MGGEQRAQHPEEGTDVYVSRGRCSVCVCVCADPQRSPVQVVGSVPGYNSYWDVEDVIDQQLQKKDSGVGHKLEH